LSTHSVLRIRGLTWHPVTRQAVQGGTMDWATAGPSSLTATGRKATPRYTESKALFRTSI